MNVDSYPWLLFLSILALVLTFGGEWQSAAANPLAYACPDTHSRQACSLPAGPGGWSGLFL